MIILLQWHLETLERFLLFFANKKEDVFPAPKNSSASIYKHTQQHGKKRGTKIHHKKLVQKHYFRSEYAYIYF